MDARLNLWVWDERHTRRINLAQCQYIRVEVEDNNFVAYAVSGMYDMPIMRTADGTALLKYIEDVTTIIASTT